MTNKIRWLSLIALLCTALTALLDPRVSRADFADTTPVDPPDRVAQLSYFSGNVTMEPAGTEHWSYVQLNRPLTTGDQLWADRHSRAELHVGSADLRLNHDTALSIVDLDDTNMQLKVAEGTLSVRVRMLPPHQHMEVDTPNLALQATSSGLFRIDVAPDGSTTTVTIRSGTAELYGNDGSIFMRSGEQIVFSGSDLQEEAGGLLPPPDAFDRWVARRDRAEDRSISARYVSREIPGYEELDDNGVWRDDPAYGEVWIPTVAISTGWAPYHEGHWAWIAPWGWTWIDDEPWGFAPFHYGRWIFIDDDWAWVPGPIVVRRPPVYAPALVAFVGGGGGGVRWSVSLTIGTAVTPGCAWVPLAPGEAWHPAYRYSPAYYSRVNYMNVTNVHNTTIVNNISYVHNTYINQRVPGAITAVPASAFVRGEPVARFAQPLRIQRLSNVAMGAGAPPIAPVRQSFAAGMRPATAGQPAALEQRIVVATRAPVVPAAFHDTLAEKFASHGGHVAGAGQPIVRMTAPPAFRHESPADHFVQRAPQRTFDVVGRAPGHTQAQMRPAPGAFRHLPAQLDRAAAEPKNGFSGTRAHAPHQTLRDDGIPHPPIAVTHQPQNPHSAYFRPGSDQGGRRFAAPQVPARSTDRVVGAPHPDQIMHDPNAMSRQRRLEDHGQSDRFQRARSVVGNAREYPNRDRRQPAPRAQEPRQEKSVRGDQNRKKDEHRDGF